MNNPPGTSHVANGIWHYLTAESMELGESIRIPEAPGKVDPGTLKVGPLEGTHEMGTGVASAKETLDNWFLSDSDQVRTRRHPKLRLIFVKPPGGGVAGNGNDASNGNPAKTPCPQQPCLHLGHDLCNYTTTLRFGLGFFVRKTG